MSEKTTIWRGQCRVCENWFQHPQQTLANPSPSGTFCPVCRDERRMTAPGVVHWKAMLAGIVVAFLLVQTLDGKVSVSGPMTNEVCEKARLSLLPKIPDNGQGVIMNGGFPVKVECLNG